MTALPVVQLSPAQPAVQEVHQPSVCRHVAGLQLGEQTWEQFLPKYPFLQTRSQKSNKKQVIFDTLDQTFKMY